MEVLKGDLVRMENRKDFPFPACDAADAVFAWGRHFLCCFHRHRKSGRIKIGRNLADFVLFKFDATAPWHNPAFGLIGWCCSPTRLWQSRPMMNRPVYVHFTKASG